jgi:hypothetical protein
MEDMAHAEEAKWDHVNESLEMLFAKVEAIDGNQQRMETLFDRQRRCSSKCLKISNSCLSKQEIAKLTIAQMEARTESPPSSSSSETSFDNMFAQDNTHQERLLKYHKFGYQGKKNHEHVHNSKIHLPKMSFPQFSGKNPIIWKDKC